MNRKKKKNHLGLSKKGNLFLPRGLKLPEHAQDTDENSSGEGGYPEPDYVKGLLDDNIHNYAQRPKQVKT